MRVRGREGGRQMRRGEREREETKVVTVDSTINEQRKNEHGMKLFYMGISLEDKVFQRRSTSAHTRN